MTLRQTQAFWSEFYNIVSDDNIGEIEDVREQ